MNPHTSYINPTDWSYLLYEREHPSIVYDIIIFNMIHERNNTTYNQASSQYVHCMYYGLPGTAYRYDDHPTLVAIVYLILNFQLSHWDQRKTGSVNSF